jgi:hypothetical protein
VNFPTWAAGSDQTESGFPTSLAIDRKGNEFTRATYSSSVTQYALLFDCDTTGAPAFDSLFWLGHNFRSTWTITISVSDSNDFSTQTNLDLSYAGNTFGQHAVELNFGIPYYQRITSARYVRFNITVPTGGGASPELGEFIVGRRRQMYAYPDTPLDPTQVTGEVVDHISRSGNRSRYKRYTGQRKLAHIWHSSGTNTDGLNQDSELRAMFAESDYGAHPVVYIHNPNTSPTIAPLYFMEHAALDMPVPAGGVAETIGTIGLIEQPPYQLRVQ